MQPQRLLFDPSRDILSQEFVIVQTAVGQVAPKLDSRAFAELGFELEYSSNSDELVSIYKINYIGIPEAEGTNGTLKIITKYDTQPSIALSYTILPQR